MGLGSVNTSERAGCPLRGPFCAEGAGRASARPAALLGSRPGFAPFILTAELRLIARLALRRKHYRFNRAIETPRPVWIS